MKRITFGLCIASLGAGLACTTPQARSTTITNDLAPVAAPAPAASSTLLALTHEPSGDIQFKAVHDLKQAPKGGEVRLRDGQEADSAEWPASLYVTFRTPLGTAACTAALLGPHVMLTAAHCVPTKGKVTFIYEGHERPYTTTCARHPQYATKDASSDFALCTVAPAFAAPRGFQYETVNSSAMSNVLNKTIILSGYGCISDSVANNQTDDKYRLGFNSIDETSDSPSRNRGATLYAPAEKNNLFTTDDTSKANLCSGDSGGPAFVRSNTGATPFGSRTIIGVNSRVFYTDASRTSYGSSLVSATGGPDFRVWAKQWAKRAGVAACGIAGTLPNCRN